ncbi:M48 family metallopeptidase [Treponema sp.]|uniref:M48 family metallopeptidase n=1 Tax=Treponema sp. TaxID=166 RepID=UPI003EFC2DCF
MNIKKITGVLCFSLALALFQGCVTTTTAAGNVGADRNQLMLISEEQMEQSADESYAQILSEAQKAGILNVDSAVVSRVNNIGKKLISQVGVFREDALSWNWQINVISDSTVNAWCMPGGKIVVYTGIIESLSLTDAQLAAVMGHEIAHALREHSREQASSEAIKNAGIAVVSSVAGLDEKGNSLLGLAAQYTITLPFSRSHETEADHIGTELMARAGYNPYEAVAVWEKMSALDGTKIPEIMSTHPSNESRIKDLKKICEKVYPLYEASVK